MHVVVAGAGIIGLTLCVELRCRGHHVTLVSPDVALGATHAAAGMLAPTSEVQYGQQRLYPLMQAAAREHPAMGARIARLSGLPTGHLANPTLLVAADRTDLHRLRETAVVQRAHEMAVEELGGRQLSRREPALAPGLAGAMAVEQDHQVDPRLLCRAALQALRQPTDADHPGPPARLVTCRVLAVHQHDGGVSVRTEQGTLAGDAVVLATGLAHHQLDGDPRRQPLALRPVHGDVLRLRVPQALLDPRTGRLLEATVRATVQGRPVYLVPRADDGLVIGATSREGGTRATLAGGVLELLQDAVRICPAVRECELVEVTTRARPATPDDLPWLGQLDAAPRVVVSTGYSRHGILLSALAARLGADLAESASRGQHHRAETGSADDQYLAATSLTRHPAPTPGAA